MQYLDVTAHITLSTLQHCTLYHAQSIDFEYKNLACDIWEIPATKLDYYLTTERQILLECIFFFFPFSAKFRNFVFFYELFTFIDLPLAKWHYWTSAVS